MEADPYEEVMREALRRIVRETLEHIAGKARLDELVREVLVPREIVATRLVRTGIGTTVPAATHDTDFETPAGMRDSAGLAHHPMLTPREQQILKRIAAGHSNKVIARELDLSLHTIKRHVANILNKLGVNSRFQAATWLHARASSAPVRVNAVA